MTYSIIIPHKNSPDLLRRCLASIPKRDDIQIIVVDDNSDKSIVNWDVFNKENGGNIKIVFTTEGKGAGYARNIGLKHAKGDWILFIDCDDTFTENLPYFLADCSACKADVIYFNSNTVINGEKKETILDYPQKMSPKEEFTMKFQKTVPWNKMVRRDFIENNHIKFEECPVGNDIFYTYQVGYFCKDRYAVCKDAIYNYYINDGSITHKKKNNEQYYLTICNHIYQCNAFYKFLGTNRKSKTMLSKLIAVLAKKGVSQFLLLLKVYLKNLPEIRQNRNMFVSRIIQNNEL